jgi:hypothetical protein
MNAKLWGVLRVSALVATVALVALLWTWQRAHAYGERVLTQVGEHMMRYAQAQHQNAPQELVINGSRFFLSTGNIEATVEDVLDHFHAKCNRRNGQLHDQWAEVAEARGVKVDHYNSWFDGVFRGSQGRRGVLACLETGPARLSPDLMLTRAKLALASGDLSRMGGLRYVFVIPGRNERVSVFVALWSEGSVNLRSMFPPSGDAPGTDPEGVPRPAATRRLIATQPKDHAAGLHVYTSDTLRRDALHAFYAAELPKAGFTLQMDTPSLLVAGDGRQTLTLSLRDDPKSGKGISSLATISQ